jgi:hypothetical protein
MYISEFNCREDILNFALKELKEIGIKGIGIKVRNEKQKSTEVKYNFKFEF